MNRSDEPSTAHAADVPVCTVAQVKDALHQLRQLPCTDGSLWDGLACRYPGHEDDLRHVLLNGYGVEVIGPDRWPDAQPGALGPRAPVQQWLVPVSLAGKLLLLCEDPWSPEATLFLSRHGQGAVLALPMQGQMRSMQQKMGALPDGERTQAAVETRSDGDSPVVAFVDSAIMKAYEDGASDIHFETDRRGVGIKYRLDGVMAMGERLDDSQRAEEVVSRIKVMAQLDITERRRPQDGRIHWQRQGHDALDLRVSVMPSIHGEDVVLRLLDKAQLRHGHQVMSLDVLGFEAGAASTIRSLASRPHGMLLITGPTGSGKTTTVYATLSEVNDGLEKVVTIEDPVEYELPGVLQIPVNEQKGLTFASGLRSILRHDPDKILVGEIRDAETAEIAVQSSLTGHLVFTTVHANSLSDVLGRFQHFGIDQFALASALNGVVVQRLLRKLCGYCTVRQPVDAKLQAILRQLELTVLEEAPVAKGCKHCRGTGYRGRFVVAEVHVLDDHTRDLIVKKSSLSELKLALYQDVGSRLLARAMQQVANTQTTIEEVSRVVGFH